jgi:archaemetzincin
MKTNFIFLLFLLGLLFSSCKEHPSSHDSVLVINPEKPLKIGIRMIGKVNPEYLKEAEFALQKTYGAKVFLCFRGDFPDDARSIYNPSRLRADSLLRFITRQYSDSADRVIGITSLDISCTKKKEPAWKYRDWGVFGLGACPGFSCVVSTYRLGRKSSGESQKRERFRKVVIHEIGHTLGLPHCPVKGCVMSDAAESIHTIDGEQEALCAQCKQKIELP